ncbi:hypothetical protein NC315_37565 [Streptomyces sp. G2]|uniref:hypothetical protein n=1 Tax=Streptomyces sp. G2 TaxID=1684471 RepID=UPI00202E6310|nr:hypothetical protein [Streptomyces sp. G2]MCM1951028.1 hypothetical protein [Streptomyces sp. G2]
MSVEELVFLLLALAILLVAGALAGIIGYAIARQAGASTIGAVGAGGIVLATTLTLGVAVLNFVVPLMAR